MGKFGWKDMSISLEDGPGGTARALTGFTVEGLDVTIESMQEDITPMGAEWEQHGPVGLKRVPGFSITMLDDDTSSTGSAAALGTVDDDPDDDGREIVVGWGGATYTFDVRLTKITRRAAKGAHTKITGEFQPTGALVES